MAHPVRLAFLLPEVGLSVRLAAIGQKRTSTNAPVCALSCIGFGD
jgi:hypothetical protein